MIRAIIIDDERLARNELKKLLLDFPEIEVIAEAANASEGVERIDSLNPDLIFLDIQMPGKTGFDMLSELERAPNVIFTTAYDEYALKAFEVNALDYLLKPVDEKELSQAVLKYKQLYTSTDGLGFAEKIGRLMQEMNPAKYKERLLIKRGQQLHSIKTADIAYCYADGKLCFATDFSSNSYLLDHTLQQLETCLEPKRFFRVNRQLLLNIDCIKKVHTWLGGRLKVELAPVTGVDTVVSRERVNGFKEWLGN